MMCVSSTGTVVKTLNTNNSIDGQAKGGVGGQTQGVLSFFLGSEVMALLFEGSGLAELLAKKK